MLDQLVRYDAVLGELAGTDGSTLLDVGSGSVGIAPWLSRRWSVTAVDSSFTDYGAAEGPAEDGLAARRRGDVLALPFADDEFDVSVALDLIEHLRPADRRRAAAELARVTRVTVIAGCPTGASALACDVRLGERFAPGEMPGWLAEHLENGFPEPAELEEMFRPYGKVRLCPNEHMARHERLMRVEFTRAGSLASRALTRIFRPLVRDGAAGRRFSSRVARAILRGGDREPAYRTIAVVELT